MRCYTMQIHEDSILQLLAQAQVAGSSRMLANHLDVISIPLFLAGSGLLQTLCLIKLIRLSIENGHHVAQFFRACAWRSQWWVRSFGEADKTTEERGIAREVRSLRLRLAHIYLNFFVVITGLSVISIQLGIAQDRQSDAPPAFYWTILLMFALSTILFLFPRMLHSLTMDMFHLALMVASAFLLSPWCTRPDSIQYMSIVILAFLRLPAASFATRPSVAVASNIGVLVVMLLRTTLDDGLQSSSNCQMTGVVVRAVVVTEVSALVLVAGISLSAEAGRAGCCRAAAG